MRDGALERAITAYKYHGRRGWALVFGRVLAGFLYEYQTTFDEFDLVTPSPTFVGPGGRSFDHTAAVLREEAKLDVPDPSRVRGKAILVYDDVFTDGLLLNTVARKPR